MPALLRTTRAGLPVLHWPALDELGVDAVVTTRDGGVSTGPYESLNLGLHVGDDPDAVVENRRRAAAAVGLALEDLVFCRQSHGNRVAVVGPEDRGRGAKSDDEAVPDTDAVVTTTRDLGLVVMVADCVPLVLLDPTAGVLAAVHAGWRGTAARVVDAAVAAMAEHGARPDRVVAGVGPAIAADRYQVGDDVLAAVETGFGSAADDLVRPDGTGRWLFDAREANRQALLEAGVADERIHVAEVSTGGDGLFSDRSARPCGRFAAIARLRP